MKTNLRKHRLFPSFGEIRDVSTVQHHRRGTLQQLSELQNNIVFYEK